MPWKTIGNQRYYYHATRIGTRVVTTYVDDEALAERLDSGVKQRKAERLDRRQSLADLIESLKVIDQNIHSYCHLITSIFKKWQTSPDYYRQLTLYRNKTMLHLPNPPDVIERALAADLARRARESGEIEQFIKKHHGDVFHTSVALLLASCTYIRPFMAQAIREKVRLIQKSLEGPNPTPIVRLLSARVSVCWLDCAIADQEYFLSKSDDPRKLDAIDRRRTRSLKRLMISSDCLAKVQRLHCDDIKHELPRFDEIDLRNN